MIFIGCAGTEAKLEYLRSLGFDETINYKAGPLKESVDRACPGGVDMFFDHVSSYEYSLSEILKILAV